MSDLMDLNEKLVDHLKELSKNLARNLMCLKGDLFYVLLRSISQRKSFLGAGMKKLL